MSTTYSSALGQNLLANMARIPLMIPGTLSERRDVKGKVNGWKLQRWHNGHNETRYIPAGQVERVREGTAGYAQFMALAQQYAEARGQQALSTMDTPADSKKKPTKR
jgi:hypothetical protein